MPATLDPPRRAGAGLFVLSAGALLFQVTFVRIFSAAIWYHFAFLVVSVALFGIGASGVALSLARDRRRDPAARGLMPLLFALCALAAYLGANAVPFSPFRIAADPAQLGWFLLDDLLLAAPFFCFGATVALVLRAWPERAGRLYAFDLVGAACGTLLVYLVLAPLGARGAVALAAALGALAAALLAPRGIVRVAALAATVGLMPLVAHPAWLPDARLDESKPVAQAIARRAGRLVFTRWDPLARIDVVESPGADPMIFLDAGAATPVAAPRPAAAAAADVSALAPLLHPGGAVTVIGSGGGVDVQNALALGARRVTAVEINPVILDLVTHRYRAAVGGVFADPRVRTVRDEGRSFVARSRERWDVLQITLIDTWAASASGAYSLSENYLYTTDAMRTFLEHLAPGGTLSITRWYYEMPRLVSLARAALVELGVRDPSAHVVVLEERLRSLMLVQRDPFTSAEMASVRAFAAASGGRILQHDPWAPSDSSFYGVFLGSADPRRFYTATDFAIQPVSDESPFFFQMTRWSRVRPSALQGFTGRAFLEPLALPVAQIALLAALGLGLLLSLALLAVPVAARAVPRVGRWRWLAYFFGLGVGYIAVEIVLMQRLALLLGHPTYSVTLVLFAILLFSGLGAAWSDARVASPSAAAVPLMASLLAALGLLAFAVPALTPGWLGQPLPVRVALALGVVAPLAFLMGMPFPLAVRALGRSGADSVAWGWAANGCGSVLGSVGAVLGAMVASFAAVLVGAALIYAMALALLARAPVARAVATVGGARPARAAALR